MNNELQTTIDSLEPFGVWNADFFEKFMVALHNSQGGGERQIPGYKAPKEIIISQSLRPALERVKFLGKRDLIEYEVPVLVKEGRLIAGQVRTDGQVDNVNVPITESTVGFFHSHPLVDFGALTFSPEDYYQFLTNNGLMFMGVMIEDFSLLCLKTSVTLSLPDDRVRQRIESVFDEFKVNLGDQAKDVGDKLRSFMKIISVEFGLLLFLSDNLVSYTRTEVAEKP